MLVTLQSVVNSEGTADRLDFARRLNDWMIFGFPELGDVGTFTDGFLPPKRYALMGWVG